MLLSPIRWLFVKAWTQPLPSFFDRRSFLYQRIPLAQARPRCPQARWIHEKPRLDGRKDKTQPSSITDENEIWPLLRVFFFIQFVCWCDNSDHYSTRDNMERLGKTIDGRDDEIWYSKDRVTGFPTIILLLTTRNDSAGQSVEGTIRFDIREME